MKKTLLLAAIACSLAVVCFFSCDNSEKSVSKPAFLEDAPNLANQTGGFYSRSGQVDVTVTNEGTEKMLSLALHDANILPHQVKLYVDKQTAIPDIASGNYEVLFLGSALILNEPETGQKFEFSVSNDNAKSMQEKLPAGYLSPNAIKTIGIAVYGNHSNHRTSEDMVPDCASSGGEGATSCSNACCSVSCSSGFYASCGTDFICIKNQKSN
jgi:hypothetical protein